jgi:N-acetylmuramoyl-L-alanine amidase
MSKKPHHQPNAGRRQALRTGGLLISGPGGLLLSLGPTQLAWGAQVLAVRVWPAQDYTRVTIESDTPLTAKHFLMNGPDRLVIDVDGLELSPQLRDIVRKVRADDPFIGGVRVGQYQPKVVRMVLDLKQITKPQVFALPPVAAYQHRMVFDLYPNAEASSPVLAQVASAKGGNVAPSVPTSAPVPMANVPASATAPAAPVQATASSAASAAPGRAASASDSAAASDRAAASVNDSLDDFIADLHRRPTDKAPAKAGTKGDTRSDIKTDGKATAKADDKDATLKAAEAARRDDEAELADLRKGTSRLVIVALDPGHGGEDPGAIGPSGLFEKHVALAIALKLRERINAQPGMRAMLTRDADFFVPLYDRVRKARRVQADLFVSIHADAFMNQQARGASVFALSEGGATSAAARWMASKENSSDQVGGVNIKASDVQVMRTLLDMSTTAQIKDSLKLGRVVLGNLGKVGRLHKAQVEQAGFAVLKAPDIPSILVETGFISNPEEETNLKDEAYQDQLATALQQGISRYFARNPPMARNRAL